MASVYLLSAAPGGPERHPKALLDLEQMRDSAAADRFRLHHVSEDPEAADLILFVETSAGAGHYYESVRRHPLHRELRDKCYLFSATDRVVPLVPGVYASIERRWYWPAWTRSGHYLGVREGGALRYDPDRSPSLLFSFVGAADVHPVRARIMQLRHPNALLIDSHAESIAIEQGERPPVGREEFLQRYVRSIADCAFVLCPRGRGTSTFRLFEAMMLGRVPVVVSDQWVPPGGPDWERFSLRVAEADVAAIPALLEARAGDAPAMGAAARAAWIDWFSQEASFHRVVEWCLDLGKAAPARAGVRRYAPYLQMMRPYHAARWAAKRFGHGGEPPEGRRYEPSPPDP